ncbi:hypothetical protein [Rickettsia felis]|nr:hypothetical protein [Rickettsia felis]
MREETASFDEAISGYLTRLPRSFTFARNDDMSKIYKFLHKKN